MMAGLDGRALAMCFLWALFPERNDCRIEVRDIDARARKTEFQWWTDDIEDAFELARWISEQGREAYFGVAARGKKKTGKRNNLSYTTAVWADVDVGETYKNREDAIAALDDLVPPSIIVGSGSGLHAYWLLETPAFFGEWRCREICAQCRAKRSGRCGDCRTCNNREHMPVVMDKAEGVMRGIVRRLDIDKCWSAPHVLRIPGTVNHKPDRDPQPVELVRFDPDRRYVLGALVDKFYEPRADSETASERAQPLGRPKSKANISGKAKTDAKEAFNRAIANGLSKTTRYLIETGDASAFRKKNGMSGDRSGRDCSVVKALLNAGAGREDVFAIFGGFRVGNKFREHGAGYLDGIIRRYGKSSTAHQRAGAEPREAWKPKPVDWNFGFWVRRFCDPQMRRLLRSLPGGANHYDSSGRNSRARRCPHQKRR